MKQIITIIVALFGVHTAFAQSTASEVLAQMQAAIGKLGSYKAFFTVETAGTSTDGSYWVDGGRYYITTGDVEVYGDAAQKYEVINSRREVVVDKVDTTRTDILSNPSQAFAALSSEFTVESFTAGNAEWTLRLKAKDASSPVKSLRLSLRRTDVLPVRLEYGTASELITIKLRKVEPLNSASMRGFEKSAYVGYEMIDFR